MKKNVKLPKRVAKYLADSGVKHNILEHRTVYTAMDAAATMKRKMGEVAKSLLVKTDKDYFLVLLPADYNLDFKKLGQCLGVQLGRKVKVVKISGEKIMVNVLKIKAGTMSAFGKLHKLPVIMDKSLVKVKKVNAGWFFSIKVQDCLFIMMWA